ncbi:MAG: iron-containing alcohol dehydrogenase [Bacilli bacterium]
MIDFFQFHSPTRIVAGEPGLLGQLAPELAPFEGLRAGIVTDRVLGAMAYFHALETSLAAAGIEVAAVYRDVPQDSDVDVVHAVRDLFAANHCGVIIAVGGGSVIDTAKAANIVMTHGGELRDYQGAHILTETLLPLIAVPTTVGTGSEVTMAAVIADPQDKRKLTLLDHRLSPALAVLDPQVTFSLPPQLTAATAMDALTHAFEAFVDLEHSPFSDMWAVAAADMIRANLVGALQPEGFAAARTRLQWASTMAGVAFNHSMVGIVHAMAHALGGVAKVPHGVANSLMLTQGLRFNLEEAPDRIADIGVRAGFVQATPDTKATAVATIEAVAALRATACRMTGMAETLTQAGVRREQLPFLVERACEDGSLLYNPRQAMEEDILQMFEGVMA